MKDFVGQELNIGDYVAFGRPEYRDLVRGVIIRFTPPKIRVQYNGYNGHLYTHLIDPENVVKLNNMDVVAMILKGED